MKQIWSLGTLLIVLAMVSCSLSNDEYAKYDTFETEAFLIKYPNNWRLDTSGYMDTEFSIFSKQTSLLDKFIENVNLLILDLPNPEMDLSAYIRFTEEKIRAKAIDNTLIESQVLTDGENTYHKLVYTEQQRIYILKFQQYYWLKNGKAYVLTLACKENEFNTYIKRGELMMNSFILK